MEMNLPFKIIQETEMEKYRARTFWTKEPETIAWIDSFQPGEVFFDIGANVGVYSLYAGSRGVTIYAFEPVIQNFCRLCENIKMNGFDNIHPFNCGISNFAAIDTLYIVDSVIGASGAQFGISEVTGINYEQTIIKFSLDSLLDIGLSLPNHIKIDVDGHEESILNGMSRLIEQSELQSLLIEWNGSNKLNLIKSFNHYGFTDINSFNKHFDHSRIRREKEGIQAENIIFTRR